MITPTKKRMERARSSSSLEKTLRLSGIGLFLAVALLFTLSAGQENPSQSFPDDPLRGSELFVTKGCIKCHAIWGVGDNLGPDLAQIGKDSSLLQLAGLLWSHSPKMIEIMQERGVSRPNFNPQEMGDLMGYIYFFNYFDQPGDYVRGEELFSEKGCARCHSVGEEAESGVIPMDEYGKYMSPSFLVTGLWNHSPDILFEMRKIGLTQPEFQGMELNHLLAYIRGRAVNESGEIIYAEPGSPRQGEALFEEKKCSVCHSVWGKGGRRADDLGKRELRLTLTEIAGKLWSHSGQMWQEMRRIGLPFPTFSPEDTTDIIAYLYFIQFFDEPGDVQEGKRLFREKECIFCHSLEGEGEDIGPDLADPRINLSPIYLASAMWNHAIIMEDMLAQKNLEWPRFAGDDMSDIVTYIQQAARSAPAESPSAESATAESKVLFISETRFDPDLAARGKTIYEAKACDACHSLGEKVGALGGDLIGVTQNRDLEWLFRFIKNPRDMLDTDGLAKQLLREFNNVPMPNQGLTDNEAVAIIEYLKNPDQVRR